MSNYKLSYYRKPLILLLLFLACSPVFAESSARTAEGLIPAVVAIPFDGQNVLAPEYIQGIKENKFDLRQFAASLVERKRLFQERWGSNQTDKPESNPSFRAGIENVELLSFMPEKYLTAFIEQGQLNVHQTGHTRGACEPAVRAGAEDLMIGIRLEAAYSPKTNAAIHYLRPKYGFVHFLDKTPVYVNPNRFLRYGEVMLVYKDQVKLRTTYTYGDSLISYCDPGVMDRHSLDPVPLTYLCPPKPQYQRVRYVEAQIWGPLDLSDISEFRVPTSRKDLAEKLKSTGKPIYAYDRDSMELCDEFKEESTVGVSRLPI
ncbi:MAG: DUF3626 domain-containing protein [Candidatus Obscuribacterales bacterium]|nr:DUF3626 domain-containing protein [Candidatus Obscuribacterales bacterium]